MNFLVCRQEELVPICLKQLLLMLTGNLWNLEVATVSIPEAKLVSIQVWDTGNVGLIEKGIHESGLN